MSVERFFSASESQQRLRAGPLARAIDGFAAWLAIEGYACCSAAEKLRFVGNLSRCPSVNIQIRPLVDG